AHERRHRRHRGRVDRARSGRAPQGRGPRVTPPAGITVGDLLEASPRALAAAGVPDARREAIALLAAALHTDRGGVLARRPDGVSEIVAERARSWIASRAKRLPLQHLTGTVEFRGL